MMTRITLPQGLTARPATRDDAQAIADMNIASDIATRGESDTTVADVYELWDNESTDLATNSCAITTQKNELIGYTSVAATSRGIMLDVHTIVHPAYQDQSVAAYLLSFAEEQARALLSTLPQHPRRLYTWSFSQARTQLLEQHDYIVENSDYRMEIILQAEPPVPQPLPGMITRAFLPGQEERAVHSVIAEAFPDIDGRPYRPFEEWYTNVFEKNSHLEPSMLYVTLADNRIVGVILCRIYPEAGDGFIWQIAVRRPWRRHGVALHLLQTAFSEYQRRGIQRVLLEVEKQNATGAHQLYKQAGMHKSFQVDVMAKKL